MAARDQQVNCSLVVTDSQLAAPEESQVAAVDKRDLLMRPARTIFTITERRLATIFRVRAS
jgi:hypothetical protein